MPSLVWPMAATLLVLSMGPNHVMAQTHQAPAPPGEELKGEKPRITKPSVAAADLKTLAADNRAFAFDLYQALRTEPHNIFLSPHSISIALDMTYAGARGETAAEMAKTLHFSLPPDRLHPAFDALDLELAARAEAKADPGHEPLRLHVVNRLWGQTGEPFLPAFLDLLSEDYGASLSLMDFIHSPDPSRIAINDWISQVTENRIRDLLAQGTINPDTRLVLTNAVYFKAAWLSQFKKERTQPLPFHPLQGAAFDVPMMQQQEHYQYTQGDGFQAIQLPYASRGEVAMLILVPDAGQFERVESSLTAERLAAAVAALQSKQEQLALPKFKFSSDFSLARTLKQLGMPLAFTTRADFSGMNGKHDLLISDVIHQAFVLADETGTEAAAATAVVMRAGAAPTSPIVLTIDRPFILLIRDLPTDTILFVGRVLNPKD